MPLFFDVGGAARVPTLWWWLGRPLAFVRPLLFTLPVVHLFGRTWTRTPRAGAVTA